MLREVSSGRRRGGRIGILVAAFGLMGAGWIIAVHWPARPGHRQQPAEAGGLVCQDAIWNFGPVDAVDTPALSHDFILTNQSQQVVEIHEVRSSCGCLVGEGYERVLPPGGSARLTANLTLPPFPGPFQKQLVVGMKSSPPAWLPLRVVGAIKPNASLYTIPTHINFGTIAPGEAKERIIQVLRYDQTPVKLLEVTGSSKALQCSFASQPTEGKGNPTIRVRLAAKELPPDTYTATVSVRTEHEQSPNLVVPVAALVARPDWGLVKSILIPNLSPNESREVLLWKRRGESDAAKVISASYRGNSALRIELLGRKSASEEPRLRITRAAQDAAPGVVQGTITVRLENVGEKIEVPITVLCSTKD